MNREILFRGKRIDNGEWVEGYYANCLYPRNFSSNTKHFIIEYPSEYHEVYTATICQYTGLTDKNGKKIWENDILRLDDGAVLKVSWHHFKASWVISKKGWLYNHFFGEAVEPEDVEVIGNIYDNPELLED